MVGGNCYYKAFKMVAVLKFFAVECVNSVAEGKLTSAARVSLYTLLECSIIMITGTQKDLGTPDYKTVTHITNSEKKRL